MQRVQTEGGCAGIRGKAGELAERGEIADTLIAGAAHAVKLRRKAEGAFARR